MSKRLSQFSDAYCTGCGRPAANGLADSRGLWCEEHGRMRAAVALEEAVFSMLRTYGRDELAAVLEGVEAYDGTHDHLRSWKLASAVVNPALILPATDSDGCERVDGRALSDTQTRANRGLSGGDV